LLKLRKAFPQKTGAKLERSLSSVEKMKNMDYPAEKDVAERTIDTEEGIWSRMHGDI
jgi:hypothetical protein